MTFSSLYAGTSIVTGGWKFPVTNLRFWILLDWYTNTHMKTMRPIAKIVANRKKLSIKAHHCTETQEATILPHAMNFSETGTGGMKASLDTPSTSPTVTKEYHCA